MPALLTVIGKVLYKLRYVLAAAMVVAFVYFFCAWLYDKGERAGYAKGLDKGVAIQKVETDKKQATINQMVLNENRRVQQFNDRVAELEKKSADLADDLDREKAKKEKVRTEIVTEYVESNPQLQTTCGWSAPTIDTINKLMESVNENIPNQP